MKRKLLFALALLISGVCNLWAQTDVTSTYITNADFSSTTGWTQDKPSTSFWALGNGQIGTYAVANNKTSTTDATHLSSEYCLGMQCRWSGNWAAFTQTTSSALPAGAYTLSFDVQNTNTSTTSDTYENRFNVTVGGNTYTDSKKEWMSGSSSWTTHTIEFTVSEASTATISLGYGTGSNNYGSGNTPHLYVSHLKLEVFPFATASDYEELNTAISAVEGKAWGFDAGEYAPYNYVEVFQALAAAQAIDPDANNSQATVQALTTTLNTTMTANAAEVNAIWDPSFEHDYSGQSGNINPIGWQRVKDAAADGYNVRLMNGSNAGLAATSSGKAIFTKQSAYYGYAEGYTMPLNANTYYTISFIYGGWGDCKSDGYVSMTDPVGSAVTLSSTDLPLAEIAADTKTSAWYPYSSFFKTGAAGNYALGLRKKSYDTSGQSQYVYGDFVLKTTTVAEATAYYNTVKTSVEGDYDASANDGAEKTAFNNALNADVSVMTVAEIMEAAAALPGLRDAFVNAVSTFDALAAEIVKAGNLGVDATIIAANTATSSTTAAEAKTYTQNLKVAEYNYVTTNYSYSVALSDTWNSSGTNTEAATFSNEHWSGETHEYKNQNDENGQGWNANSWDLDFNQNVTLPAGSYVFKVAGRRASGNAITMSLVVKQGETVLGTVSDFPQSNSSRGINKNGATAFEGDNSEFANNGAGFGWEWRYVKFDLDNLATVNIGVHAEASASHQWISFGDYTLQADNADVAALLAALAEYDAALAAANAAMTNTAYANVQGLEKTYLQEAIDADGTLDKSSLEAVQTATSHLTANTNAFTEAVDSYDAFYQAKAEQTLTKITENVGDGVFQYNATTNDNLWDAYESAKSTVDYFDVSTGTASAVKSYADALNGAINAYNTQALNAPDVSKRYKLTLANKGALTFFKNPDVQSGYGMPFQAAGDYKAQTFQFEAVSGKTNTYLVYFTDNEGQKRYICNGIPWGAGTGASGIRTLLASDVDPDNNKTALEIQIQPAATDGVFYMLNTTVDNAKLGAQNNGDLYTVADNSDWSIAEASQAEFTVSCKAGKYGTVIFPFAVDITEFSGVKFYSCESVHPVSNRVQIEEVTTLEANVPYLIQNEGTEDFSQAVSGWGIATADSYTDAAGLLTGVYTNANINGDNRYVLQTPTEGDDAGVQAFYKVNGDFTATPYKCYLTYAASNPVKALFLGFNDADAIRSIDNESSMFNVESSKVYNLAGQRLQKLQKGINIVNGKKVLVK